MNHYVCRQALRPPPFPHDSTSAAVKPEMLAEWSLGLPSDVVGWIPQSAACNRGIPSYRKKADLVAFEPIRSPLNPPSMSAFW